MHATEYQFLPRHNLMTSLHDVTTNYDTSRIQVLVQCLIWCTPCFRTVSTSQYFVFFQVTRQCTESRNSFILIVVHKCHNLVVLTNKNVSMGASRGRWGQIKHSLSGFFKESKLKKKKKIQFQYKRSRAFKKYSCSIYSQLPSYQGLFQIYLC